MKIKASILEVQGYDLGKPLDVKNIENKAEQAIEKKLNKMLTMFQENIINPIAVGDIARSKTRNFNRKHWEEVYPHIPIDLAVDIEMLQTGIAE